MWYTGWGNPWTNPADPAVNDYLFLKSATGDRGTAEYGKWWADKAAPHKVLCESEQTCPDPVDTGTGPGTDTETRDQSGPGTEPGTGTGTGNKGQCSSANGGLCFCEIFLSLKVESPVLEQNYLHAILYLSCRGRQV